jgi:hypothetical protein
VVLLIEGVTLVNLQRNGAIGKATASTSNTKKKFSIKEDLSTREAKM